MALAQSCNCYWSSDCGTGNSCGGYGSCNAGPKNDGTCTYNGLLKKRLESPVALGSALDYFFKAYLKAIDRGGGAPDSVLVEAAQSVPLSSPGHDLVEYTVWVSLDAEIGWDFIYPSTFLRVSGFPGNIREVNTVKSSSGLVDAARRGLLSAMQSGDQAEVVAPVREFWAKNPTFAPSHLGRCYPHGHDEITDSAGCVRCQLDTLQRLAVQLIGSTTRANSSPVPNR